MKILVAGIFFYDFSKKYWETAQTCEYRWLTPRKSGVPSDNVVFGFKTKRVRCILFEYG